MTDLGRQLAAYTDYLEERSLARSADHTSPATETGDVIVLDLMLPEYFAQLRIIGTNYDMNRIILFNFEGTRYEIIKFIHISKISQYIIIQFF